MAIARYIVNLILIKFGGHLEKYESWEQCAIREAKEETNLNISNLKFVYLTNDIFEKEERHYITIFMRASEWKGDVKVMEPDKVEKWEWIEWKKDSLPSPLFQPLDNLLKEGKYSPIE